MAILLVVTSKICSKQPTAFLCNSYLAISSSNSFDGLLVAQRQVNPFTLFYCWRRLTLKWFQVLPSNTNTSTCTHLNGSKYCYDMLIIQFNVSFVFTQLNSFKYSNWQNKIIWLVNGILTGTIILDQSGPGSNGIEGVPHIPYSSKTRTLLCTLPMNINDYVPFLINTLGVFSWCNG